MYSYDRNSKVAAIPPWGKPMSNWMAGLAKSLHKMVLKSTSKYKVVEKGKPTQVGNSWQVQMSVSFPNGKLVRILIAVGFQGPGVEVTVSFNQKGVVRETLGYQDLPAVPVAKLENFLKTLEDTPESKASVLNALF